MFKRQLTANFTTNPQEQATLLPLHRTSTDTVTFCAGKICEPTTTVHTGYYSVCMMREIK